MLSDNPNELHRHLQKIRYQVDIIEGLVAEVLKLTSRIHLGLNEAHEELEKLGIKDISYQENGDVVF